MKATLGSFIKQREALLALLIVALATARHTLAAMRIAPALALRD